MALPPSSAEQVLITRVRQGDSAAWQRLIDEYEGRLLAFALRRLRDRQLAEDVVQDTWESAVRGLPRLSDPASFRAWIYAIAARKCADALRGKYRDARIAESAQAMSAEAAHAEGAQNDRLDIADALKRLAPEQRVALSLFFGEGLSVADIATITGAPAGTVKSRLFAARRALREIFGDDDVKS